MFYDYDELTLLRECNFRVMPEPTTPEQEMASEPWFSVGESDTFSIQDRIAAGELIDILPYGPGKRLRH